MNKILFRLSILFMLFLFISCEKDVSTSPKELPPDNGTLVLISIPPNAKIILDGRNSGYFTPDTIRWLSDTTHEIVLQKRYYRDTTLYIETKDGEITNAEVDYTKNTKMYGRVIVESYPSNGLIYFDGQNLARFTPDTLLLVPPGKHNIKVYHDGFREVEKNIEVFSFHYTRTNLTLIDTSIWVTYHSSNSTIPTNNFRCLEIDNQGRKCLGTADTGLVIYDEKNWYVWNKSNTPLPADNIICLKSDHSGKMWIGTSDGLAIYDNGNWQIINTNNSPIPSNFINSIDVGPLGDALIGTRFGLARFYPDNSWSIFTKVNSGMPANWVTSVMFDGDNDFFAAVFNSGLARFHNNEWHAYGIPGPYVVGSLDSKHYKNITAMYKGEGDDLWFGNSVSLGASSRAYVIYFDGVQNWEVKKDLGENQINSIYVDLSDLVWVSTFRGLINLKFNGSSYTFDKNNSQLMSNLIFECKMDQNNVLWIATYGGGLTKKKPDN